MSTAELDTKQNWDDCHFDQHPTHTMHLSGCTIICGQLKICSSTGFTSSVGAGLGKVWTSNASGVGTWQTPSGTISGATNLGGGNGTIYTTASGNKLQLKSLSGGTNITLTCNGNYIAINSAGGSGSSVTGATNGLCKYDSNNVCLGGAITGSVLLCGNSTGKNINICNIDGNCNNITNFCCGIFSTCSCDVSLTWKSCLAVSGFAQISATNNPATQCNIMQFRPDAIYLTIGGTSSGLQYAGDYCSKFNLNCRSIPDVDWVKRWVTANTTASMSGTANRVAVFNATGNNVCNTTATFISNVLCNNSSLTIEVPDNNTIYLAAPTVANSQNKITLGKPTQSSSVTQSIITADGLATTIDLYLIPKGVSTGTIHMFASYVNIANSGNGGLQYLCAARTLCMSTNAIIAGRGGDVTQSDSYTLSMVGGAGYSGFGCSGNGGDICICGGNAQGSAIKRGGDIIFIGGTPVAGGANGLICMCSQACASSTITASNFILSSDCRLKTNIQPINISPVCVEYKQYEMISEPNQIRYGVLAQDLQKVNPELVRVGADGMLTIAQMDLVFKELAYLKNKVVELENRIK